MKILKYILCVFLLFAAIPAIGQDITEQKIQETRIEFIEGLTMLSDLPEEDQKILIQEFANSLTKLWILEHATVENGLFKLYIEASDIFIDKEGNLYFKSESEGYIRIGNDEYNIEGDIVLNNDIAAFVQDDKKGIFRLEAKLSGLVYTDFENVDFDIAFLVQIIKIKKISLDIGVGMHTAGGRLAYNITDNFDIGLYGGIGYPREELKWRPVMGLGVAFQF